ncbi:hypothetical protein NL676_032619 [Syzygium grande]|nr:hypothetical protein NL676_032619 [Syzygium grande]
MTKAGFLGDGGKMSLNWLEKVLGNAYKIHHSPNNQQAGSKRFRKTWWRNVLFIWVIGWIIVSLWIFWYLSSQAAEKRRDPR